MAKRIITIFLSFMMILNLCGCLALVAGAGGTALWQAGKVISEESVSMSQAVKAVEETFKAKKITVTDKVSKNQAVQLRGKNQNAKKVAVDIFSKGTRNVKIEIRIGVGEEESSRELLREIKRRL